MSSRPGGARRPEHKKAEALKIELTDNHTPLGRLADTANQGKKSHFICKMKLRNECPPLPYEPKFLAYPSEPNRLTKYTCTTLEKNHKHALLTEPDLGIHIDLIEPETYDPPTQGIEMQAEDAVLLQDAVKRRKMRPGLEGDRGKRPNVPWLHKTAYYGNEDLFEMQMGSKNLSGTVQEVEQEVELSPMQAAEKLASSFAMPDLATLKHPSKKDVTAVKVWEVMPDYQTWANDYTEIVFDHDPTTCDVQVAKQLREETTGDTAKEGQRKRKILGATAFMHVRMGDPPLRRTSLTELEHPSKIFGFYLPAPDSKRRKRATEDEDAAADADDEGEPTEMHCVREHVENEARKYMEEWNDDHFVFAFVDGENGQPGRAQYHPLKSRTYLRKAKDVISFDNLNDLDDEDLRLLRKRGNRFPKFFKGLQQVRGLDESNLEAIATRTKELQPKSVAAAPVANGAGSDSEMQDAGPAQPTKSAFSSPEPEIRTAPKKVVQASSSSSSSDEE